MESVVRVCVHAYTRTGGGEHVDRLADALPDLHVQLHRHHRGQRPVRLDERKERSN